MVPLGVPRMKVPAVKPNDENAAPEKSFWNMVLHSTPVVLTVVATVLAGLSSSEMTQAQYHRSLAAQNQSKASDQWTFFQFKRTRGQQAKIALDSLPALSKTDRLEPATLRSTAERLVKELHKIDRQLQSVNSL